MHKVGLCIVAHAPALQRQRSIANLSGGYPRNANVDGFGFHMLTVQRNSMTMFAKIVIAPRSAIPANDVDLAVEMPQFGQQVMQEIKLPGVIVLHVAGAMVAKKMIQRRNALRKVLIAYPVDDIQMFTCMKVIEAKPVGRSMCVCSCVRRPRSGNGRER